ncbi:PH domain-containing protein [Sphaerisporangium fuscum]|uniref:PH domain-containing protein n=1 Tax=Sphaerisporangium fuscum TaxID=2835868 RepID=UPI0027E350A9|nr:PH domain-containing protein [Sphaerisporangium fuscum]
MTVLRDPAHRVSRRAITLWSLEALFGLALLVGGAALVAAWASGSGRAWLPAWVSQHIWWLPVAVAVVELPFVVIEPLWRYAVHRWELSGDVVYARSGWFSRQWVFVPVSRIQTVDNEQGWFERLLGLATLEIRTASYAGSSSIRGLDAGVAARLAQDLAHRAHQLRDDAT